MKIGIDLGATNSARAYIDESEAEDRDFPPVHIFETPQLVAAGRIEARRTLPSFLFLEEGQPVGVYAREQCPRAWCKPWLSNPDADRTARWVMSHRMQLDAELRPDYGRDRRRFA